MKMTRNYALFLDDDDPQMRQQGLTQPVGAEAAWREHMLQPRGAAAKGASAVGGEPWQWSERMVLYVSTRSCYTTAHELTVDYGKAYKRSYASGCHHPGPIERRRQRTMQPAPMAFDDLIAAVLGE